jgi:hypothetical protein
MVDLCLFRSTEACTLRNDRLAVVLLNIGIEPSTAPLDSPENARQWGYPALLEGHGEIRWRPEIEINPVDPVVAGPEK